MERVFFRVLLGRVYILGQGTFLVYFWEEHKLWRGYFLGYFLGRA
jgi:hypothetical protein